jgi:hypothetical protein
MAAFSIDNSWIPHFAKIWEEKVKDFYNNIVEPFGRKWRGYGDAV